MLNLKPQYKVEKDQPLPVIGEFVPEALSVVSSSASAGSSNVSAGSSSVSAGSSYVSPWSSNVATSTPRRGGGHRSMLDIWPFQGVSVDHGTQQWPAREIQNIKI